MGPNLYPLYRHPGRGKRSASYRGFGRGFRPIYGDFERSNHTRYGQGSSSGVEVFKEFSAVLSRRLSAHFQGKNRSFFVSDKPRVSTQGNPESQTIGCCAFVVENWPVEVRVSTGKLTARNEMTRLNQTGLLEREILC